MTGPEHYREAERLLAKAVLPSAIVTVPAETPPEQIQDIKRRLGEKLVLDIDVIKTESIHIDVSSILAAAQVHATLALAAATAEPIARSAPTTIPRAWSEAISS